MKAIRFRAIILLLACGLWLGQVETTMAQDKGAPDKLAWQGNRVHTGQEHPVAAFPSVHASYAVYSILHHVLHAQGWRPAH